MKSKQLDSVSIESVLIYLEVTCFCSLRMETGNLQQTTHPSDSSILLGSPQTMGQDKQKPPKEKLLKLNEDLKKSGKSAATLTPILKVGSQGF